MITPGIDFSLANSRYQLHLIRKIQVSQLKNSMHALSMRIFAEQGQGLCVAAMN